MTRRFGRIAAGAWLLGAAAVAPHAQAQPARTWSDPPPDLNVTPLVAPSETAKPVETQDWPDEATRRRPGTKTAQPSPSPDPNKTELSRAAPKETSEAKTAQASAAARKAREKQAAARKIRKEHAERAREERTAARKIREAREARAEGVRQERAERAREEQARRLAAARERRKVARQAATARQAQAPQQRRYEVMRLRTILLPDGRMVDVLTRPDQEIEGLVFD